MRCVLVGNYGIGNIGDEALREFFLSEFQDVQWTVVSGLSAQQAGNVVPRLPLGLRSLFAPWWRTIAAIARADAVVFGGGSLFTDIESVWACVLWSAYVFVAKLLRKPYFLAFQGAGPWKTWLGFWLSCWAYRGASFISVRDEESLQRVGDFKPRFEPILTFDPAFTRFSKARKQSKPKNNLIIIPRANATEEFYRAVCSTLQDYSGSVTVLLLEPEREGVAIKRLQRLAEHCRVVSIRTVDELLAEMASGSFVLTQRYHGALAAVALDVSVDIIPQAKGDKMDALRTAVSEEGVREQWLSLIHIGEETLREVMKSAL